MEDDMKFATFEHDGRRHVGLLQPAANVLCPVDATDMIDLITRFDALVPSLSSIGPAIPVSQVHLLAPIPEPRRNIFCVGKNYREHANEFSRSGYEAGARPGSEPDEFPAVFTKPPSCVIGTGAPVPTHPNATEAVDYEGELAVIIGRGGRDIPKG
jgi:2-keto-4-pentenoate hydratase/2-oxohepta-3-ene-1,7-dioic acid hydratase in catechol pathway